MIRFVVLAAPRTGSNWLCSLLDSHPAVLCHHEIFNPEGIHTAISTRTRDLGFGTVAERDLDPLSVLERVWQCSLGNQAVGFKLNRGQNAVVFRRVLANAEVRKIVIRRSNRVRTYVSETLAERTGEWESYEWVKTRDTQRTVWIDPDQLQRHISMNRRYYDEIDQALAASRAPALHVRYEDLSEQQVRQRMLQFLDVSPVVSLRPGTRRQNPAPLKVLIENFKELRHALQGSDLQRDLLDEGEDAEKREAGG
jgi:LPS sulfotransferase NodH